MPLYRVKHGHVRFGRKRYSGDKRKPGKGDTFEAPAEAVGHLVKLGFIELVQGTPVDTRPPQTSAPEPKGKGKDK